MTVKHLPRVVNTVIVGSGPSALILSYILHGHIPYYNTASPHPDAILHEKLSRSPCLLDVDVDDLTAHFGASRLSYSNQALPVNVLLDTLIRPLADTSANGCESCVEWCNEETNIIDHIVVGRSGHIGGQWAENPVSASWDISALSYAEMLSLPGYSFKAHYADVNSGESPPDFYRPTRREVATYLSAYPKAVGIRSAIYTGIDLGGISSTGRGFYIASHDIVCQNLVLASGVFTDLIPPRPLLQPLKSLPDTLSRHDTPLLVVGSGFTAADVILSAPAGRKIIHLYKWDPEDHPSPLRACHRSVYPEYASVYRRMKLAAGQAVRADVASLAQSKNDPVLNCDSDYEGLPNTYITDVKLHDHCATLQMLNHDNRMITRTISNFEYVIGRMGSLGYLDKRIRQNVIGSPDTGLAISAQTLRPKIEKSLEVSPHMFAIGSLTGDSLIRFAYGGCVLAARRLFEYSQPASPTPSDLCCSPHLRRLMPRTESRNEENRETLRADRETVYG